MRLAATARRIDAIVFDLDGILIDSETHLVRAWEALFAEHGATISQEEWALTIGTSGGSFDRYGTLAARAKRPLPGREQIFEEMRERIVPLLDAAGPMPGVTEWLDAAEAAGLRVGVATSSSRRWLTERLAGIGIDSRVHATVATDDGFSPKPAPDLYLEVCRRLDVEPRHAIAVEDSAHGLAAALAAGLTCVAVPCSVTAFMDFTSAHRRISSLTELRLEDLLDELAPAAGAAHDRSPMRRCVRCGIETAEERCFICGQPTSGEMEIDWSKNPNPFGSDC